MSDIVAYAKVTSANGKVMAEAGSMQHTDDVRLLTFTDNISLNGNVIGVLTAAISPASNLLVISESVIVTAFSIVVAILPSATGIGSDGQAK